MTTTTHVLNVSSDAYSNISNGNINITITIEKGSDLRLVIGGAEPPADTPDYIAIDGPGIMTVTDLIAEDDVWVRAGSGQQHCQGGARRGEDFCRPLILR